MVSKKKISFNKKYLMKINTGEYEVSINKIKKIIDVESLIEKKKNVEENDICEIVIHSSELIPMDDYTFNKSIQDFVCLMKKRLLLEGLLI